MALNTYDDIIMMGDFDIDEGIEHNKWDVFRDTLNLINLVKSDTSYTNNHKSITDLFLTNKPFSFQFTSVMPKSKILLFSEMRVDEKNLHPGGRKFFFFNRFSGEIFFSSLVSFDFFCILFFFFCLFVCFSKLKLNNLTHIRLYGEGEWSKYFYPVDFRFLETRLLFFRLTETVLSSYHRLIATFLTFMRSHFSRLKSRIIHYRSSKRFVRQKFITDVKNADLYFETDAPNED